MQLTQNIWFNNWTFNVKGAGSVTVDKMALSADNNSISIHYNRDSSSSSSTSSEDDDYSITSSEKQSTENKNVWVKAPVIEPHQSLKDFEKEARIIWYWSIDICDAKTPTKNERIRIMEERKNSDYESPCSKTRSYYDKWINYINKTNIENEFIDESFIRLESMIIKLYNRSTFNKWKMGSCAWDILLFVKSIIGEKTKEKLVKVILISFLKILKSVKKSLYKVIKNLTVLKDNRDFQQKIIKMIEMKPYKKNEKKYYRFLNVLMINLTIFKEAAENMKQIFEYLSKESSSLCKTTNFVMFTKISFYGIIYENFVIKEWLGQVDRNGLMSQFLLNSNYETSSDDSSTCSQSIRYDPGELHNYFNITDGDKAQWALFILQSKCMSVKDMQVVSRYSPNHNFYKLYFNGEITDPYGEKNAYKEIQKFSDFEDFLNYKWSPDNLADSSSSDDDLNEAASKKLKSTLDCNCSSSDSSSDTGKNIV